MDRPSKAFRSSPTSGRSTGLMATTTRRSAGPFRSTPAAIPANPLTGVFACRAPVRPNLIGFTACRIIKVEGNIVEVADLDAQNGSPILDLKPYIPAGDAIPDAVTPEWLKRSKPPAD